MSFVLALLAAAPAVSSQDVVDLQLAAFRAGNLEAVVSSFDPNAEIYNYPNRLKYRGRDAIRAWHKDLIQENRKVRTSHRTVINNIVVDQERVTLDDGSEFCCVVQVYHVTGGKIDRVDVVANFEAPKN